MKLLIIDSTKGAQTLINSIKTVTQLDLDFKLVKLHVTNLSKINKQTLRDYTLKILTTNLQTKPFLQNYDLCIIMCISASSSIFDILIKRNFIIANTLIIEPIIPMCLYIKKHKLKTLLILSTSLTHKIGWFSKLLNGPSFNIVYACLNLIENEITNSVKVNDALSKLITYKAFIAKCDGIIIGCSSYSLIKPIIARELKSSYDFNGQLLDSSVITFDYYKALFRNT
jgi:glutamate racemase